MSFRIGIDLGGTKIEGIVIDAVGTALARERVPTPRGSYDGTLHAIAELVATLERRVGGRCSVGIGMPGAVSPASGLIKNANSTWLNGKPFVADLSAALGRPVRVANDADCFALSEASDGAAAGAATVFGVIIGTGTGGGVVANGRLLAGPNAIAGEWGHNMLPWPEAGEWPGPPCYCGRTGCIETFLSGPGFERDHEAATGVSLSAPEIVKRAEAGDAACVETLRRYESRLARGLASIINVLDPHVIVLGGGMSNLPTLYERVPQLWDAWVFSDRVDTKLVKA
ncbi:MAG TPA: ROK family protein, partial [Vicinamibacterales bacterium]